MLGKTAVLLGVVSLSLAAAAVSQPLTKSAIQVDPGNTKQMGQTFASLTG